MIKINGKYRVKRRVFFLCILFAPTTVLANTTFEPAAIPVLDGALFRPTATVALGYDDNVTSVDTGKVDSGFALLSTVGDLIYGGEINHTMLSYGMEKGLYFDSSKDDYFDYSANLISHYEFTVRHRIDATLGYSYSHEARGTGISEGVGNSIDEPVEIAEFKAGIDYGLGVDTGLFTMKFNLGYYDKAYQNFRTISQYRDYDSYRLGGTTYYRVMSKTKLLLDVSYEVVSYDKTVGRGISWDSDIIRALVGVDWEATAKTTGFVKFGVQDKDFDSDDREDFSGLTWDVGVIWLPRSYSRVQLITGMEAKDPDTVGDYIEERISMLVWSHYWLERFGTTASFSFVDKEYTGTKRDDDITSISLGANYDFKRFLTLSLNFTATEQDSSDSSIEYDKNVIMFSVMGSL